MTSSQIKTTSTHCDMSTKEQTMHTLRTPAEIKTAALLKIQNELIAEEFAAREAGAEPREVYESAGSDPHWTAAVLDAWRYMDEDGELQFRSPEPFDVIWHRIPSQDRWVQTLAPYSREVEDATVIEVSQRLAERESWDATEWLKLHPEARFHSDEPAVAAYDVEDGMLDADGFGTWDVAQLDANDARLAEQIALDTRIAEMNASFGEVTIGERVIVSRRRSTDAWSRHYNRQRNAERQATGDAAQTVKNRALLVQMLVDLGHDPKDDAVVGWVKAQLAKAKAAKRTDGYGYAMCMTQLQRREARKEAVGV